MKKIKQDQVIVRQKAREGHSEKARLELSCED